MMRTLRTIRIVIALMVAFLFLVVFSVGGGYFSGLLSTQLGPALLGLATGTIVSGVMVAAGILAATILFGRVYCSVLCPLGTMQEWVGLLHKKTIPTPNLRWVRYTIAALSFVLLISGWAIGFKVFEPFSRTGSIISAARYTLGNQPVNAFNENLWKVTVAGVLSLVFLIALVLWKNRIYCTAICPIGTILGLLSKISVFGVSFTRHCVGCGKCATVCPTDCLDSKSHRIDAERCIVCLNCLAVCNVHGLAYKKRAKGYLQQSFPVDPGRRMFLAKGTVAMAVVLAAGLGVRKIINSTATANESLAARILPPGAGTPEQFYKRCTGCQLCTAACPERIIKPALMGFGPVYLDYSIGACKYDCVACSAACPTGALNKLSPEDKRFTRLGTAVIDAQYCKAATKNEPCHLCVKACPAGAIYLMKNKDGIFVPQVNAFHCIGCGACQAACPSRPFGITVKPNHEQQLM